MATTEAQSTFTADRTAAGTEFIRRKINQTRRSVKLAELVAGLMLFGAGSLLFLLALALVDHWIVGLSFGARLVAFCVYVVAGAAFLWIYVVPLLFHSINPLYAARIIEQGQPTLKNSLLNFLFLSKNQQGTRQAVLEAIESQAAADISALKLEHLVDYTKAIRMGYVLAALAVLFGLYQMLSPKDPLQTAARVAMPWTDIARPSRVNIVEVQPGDTTIYQGEELEVSAKIHDAADDDKLQVVYSTQDGQIVDQSVPLELSEDGVRFTARLSTSEAGIQQNLTYRVEAGDAVTREFEVITLEAPAIDVTSLRYDFPAYTQDRSREQSGDGQIRALEGTQVTIRSVANRPIAKAYVEFDPQEDAARAMSDTVPMQVDREDPTRASVQFPLLLNAAGTAGKYRSYQVRFRTDDGVLNPHPVVYAIDTIRDLPPEIEVLEPNVSEVEVPENGSLAMRFRALDPDFAIRQIHVHGTRTEQRILESALLEQPQAGQVMASWNLVPRDHQLRAGDVVEIVAIAEDNKTSVAGKPNPNLAKSRPRIVRIIEPMPGQTQQPNDGGTNDGAEGEGQDEMAPQNGGSDQDNQEGEPGEKSGGDGAEGEDGEASEGDQQKEGEHGSKGESGKEGEQGQAGQAGQNGQAGEMQDGEPSGENQQPADGQGGRGSQNQAMQDQQDGQQQENPSDAQQQGSPQQGDSQDGQPQPGQGGQGQPQGEQNGQEEPAGEEGVGGSGGKASSQPGEQQKPSDASNQEGGANGRGTGKPGDPSRGGELQQGDASTQPNENSQVQKQDRPVAPDGSQDGDAFERIQEYLKEKQQTQSGADASQQPEPQSPESQPSEGDGSGQQEMPQNGDQDPTGGGSQAQQDGAENQAGEGTQPQGAGTRSGQQEGMPQEQPGVDNGSKPEQSATGQDARTEEGKEGAPGTTDNNEGESIERNTQNSEQGAGENQGGAVQKDTEANPSQASERAGDTGKGDNTDSGAGMESNKDDTGSPESSETSNKQSKNEMPADQQQNDEEGDQPKSPSNGNKQSQSQGDNRGDVSGGGKSGGGQSAKQAGNDSAGSTSAGDEGAGAAQQQGEGETGQDRGDGPQADQQTGSAGSEQGEGSQMSDSPAGDQPGPMGQQSEPSQAEGHQPPRDPQQNGRGPGNSAIPQGGGLEGQGAPPSFDGPRVEPGEDEANLEYAQQATDMVLDRLKHQRNNPDQEMLDQLGWSKEDFQRFVDRWQKMKSAAGSENPEAARELNEALRSLGLSRGEDRVRRIESRQSTAGGSGDTQRSSPPPSFLEQYRAYLKGASQSGAP